MNMYLLGQGCWSYINDVEENRHNPKNANYSTWEQAASRAMYFLATSVEGHMLSHIRDTKRPNEAWDNPMKIFSTNTTAQKLHSMFFHISYKDCVLEVLTAPGRHAPSWVSRSRGWMRMSRYDRKTSIFMSWNTTGALVRPNGIRLLDGYTLGCEVLVVQFSGTLVRAEGSPKALESKVVGSDCGLLPC